MGILWATVVIAVMDWETKLVSEVMVVVCGGLVILSQLLTSNDKFLNPININGLIAGLVVIGGLWAISKGKAMGFGDVELVLVLGWWLGWPKILVGLWFAFVTGAIISLWYVITGRAKLKSEIAFGPFLIMGGWIAYFWGNFLWQLVVI
jgi:prepilin signal peptidase PulO-like enzyme (type II secretory pathway)